MLKAREILDSYVTLSIANDGPTLVTFMNNATKLYYVYNRTVSDVVVIACEHLRAT